MSAWQPEGAPTGKGTKEVTLPRPGHADLAGALKYGLSDIRDALERASARHTAVIVAAGSVAKALLAEIGVEVAGQVLTEDLEQRVDEARADRDTVGGVVEVRARGVPPGLGSYATKDERLDARLAATLMGTQAVKGVEIGEGFELGVEARFRCARRDPARRARALPRDEPRRRNRGRRLERRGDRRARRDEAVADTDEAARVGRPADGRARGGARRTQRHRGRRGTGGRGRGLRGLGACTCREGEVRRRRARRLPRRTSRLPARIDWSARV